MRVDYKPRLLKSAKKIDWNIKKVHTKKDATCLLHLLRKTISEKVELIGSFGKGSIQSSHDIDVLIPDKRRTNGLKNKLMNLLDAQSVEDTDWGGWYFYNTFYGNVDVFFSTKDFDY